MLLDKFWIRNINFFEDNASKVLLNKFWIRNIKIFVEGGHKYPDVSVLVCLQRNRNKAD